jgi:hypothetical protein
MLLFAKVLRNGQGSLLRFHAGQCDSALQYTTFWNDFTYYRYTDQNISGQEDLGKNVLFSDPADLEELESGALHIA